jgi:photosystem II stability/assembly factor-like uncharacterized protein
MKRILALGFFVMILSACSSPAVTPTSTVPLTVAPPTLNAAVSSAPAFTMLRMIDAANGWAITDTGVVRTNDGGQTWHDVTPSGVARLGLGTTFYFLDSNHGWVVSGNQSDPTSGMLYRTQDGGATWQSNAVSFFMGNLVFVSASDGWMMSSLGVAVGSNAVAIFQTTDGGQTWKQTYVNDPTKAGAATTLPLGGLKDGIIPVDMNNAWVGGIIYTPGEIYLYQTQDGGQTWKLQPVQIPSGYDQAQFETVGPQFVSAQDAYLPVHVSTQNGVMLAVYYSHDGGSNWAITPLLIPNGGLMNFVSTTDGFVWNGTEFYVTHDGAKTWTTVSPGVSFGDNFAGMDFVNTTLGFVLTNDATNTRTLYKTVDGGSTWTVAGK